VDGDGSTFWTIVAFAFVLGTVGLLAWVLAYWYRNAIQRRPVD
jgi:hypothetical protein